MAAKRTPGSRPGLVRCDHCGEEYSESYRRCPFCADHDADAKYEAQRARALATGSGDAAAQASGRRTTTVSRTTASRSSSGGKRLSNRRGGGYKKISAGKIIVWLLSLAVIIAAIWILVTQVGPLIRGGKDVDDEILNSPPATSQPGESPDVSPGVTDPVEVEPSPDVEPSAPVSTDTATGFVLKLSDFTLNDKYPDPVTIPVTFSPAGTTAVIQWSSSDSSIVSVDANGTVSHGSKRGTATITASMANGVTQTCLVHNQVTSGSAYEPEPSSPQSAYSLSNTDFTFFSAGESCKLKISGYTGVITWRSSNTNVATVDANGTVTATGTGKASCKITATLGDGTVLEAIARISIS